MKRKRKRPSGTSATSPTGGSACNPKLHAQTRKALRTHYAAKYRVR